MTHITKRPEIKDYFEKDIDWKEVHETYTGNESLFNYTKDLDFYIDYIEETNTELRKDISTDIIILSERIKFDKTIGLDTQHLNEFKAKLSIMLTKLK